MKPPLITIIALIFLALPLLWGNPHDNFSLTSLLNPEASIQNLIRLAQKQKDSDVGLAIATISYAEELSEKYGCEFLGYKARYYHCLYLLHKGENRESLAMIEEILPFFQRPIYPWHEATLYNRLGSIYGNAAQFDTAIYYLEKARDIFSELDRKGSLSFTYQFLAYAYAGTGSYAKALECSYNAVELAEETSSAHAKFLSWVTVGNIYLSFEDYETAEEYFQRALRPQNRHKNPIFRTKPLNKLGIIAFERGEYTKAKDLLTRSLILHIQYENRYDLPETYYYLGQLALKEQDISEAWCYLETSKQASQDKQSIREELKAELGLAELYTLTSNYEQTYEIAQRVLEWAQVQKDYEFMYASADILAESASRMGAYRDAYTFRTIHQMANDSVLNAAKAKQITAIQMNNLYQRKELEQARKLDEQERAYTGKLQASRNMVQKLSAAIGIFSVLLILLFYLNYLRKKAGKQLSQKNKELNTAQQDLATKNSSLEQYIESNLQLENFAYMASHDLKAPLNNILSFSKLLARSSFEKLSAKEQKCVNYIISGATNMQALIEALLNFSQVESNKLELDRIHPKEILEAVQGNLASEIEEKQAEIIFENMPEHICADWLKLYQLFLNLFSNALKFAKESQRLQIQVSSQELAEHWQFAISDSGIGIAEEFQERIFMIFKRLHTQDEIEGTGIGLALCKKIVEQHEGQIWVESQEGLGSTFFFTLKKYQLPEPVRSKSTLSQLSFL